MVSKTKKLVAALSMILVGSTAAAEQKMISFIELNDLHANLVPHPAIMYHPDGSNSIEQCGGLAKHQYLINQIRTANTAKGAGTVLMMVGDTFHGGVEALYSLGNNIVDLVNTMGADVGVAGNWDYYYTPMVTRLRYGRIDKIPSSLPNMDFSFPMFDDALLSARPNYPSLGANVKDITDIFMPTDFMPAYYVKEFAGVKVGFIGLTSDIVEEMHPMLAMGLDFSYGLDEHVKNVDEAADALRAQGIGLIVLMSELGTQKTMAVANKMKPGITAAFVAHTHEAMFHPLTTDSGAVLVEAGDDGYLGVMDLTVDVTNVAATAKTRTRKATPAKQTVVVKNIAWDLKMVGHNTPDDPAMLARIEAVRAPYLADDVHFRSLPFMIGLVDKPIDTEVAHIHNVDSSLTRNGALERSFDNSWADKLREYTHTDLAMTPGFRMGYSLAKEGETNMAGQTANGSITLESVYRLFPMFYQLATGDTTGANLKRVMEEALVRDFSSTAFRQGPSWVFGMSGVDIVVDFTKPDYQRITSMKKTGSNTQIVDTDVLSITGCRRWPIDYMGTLCGVNGFTNIQMIRNPKPGPTGIFWNIADAFEYITNHTADSVSRKTFTVAALPAGEELYPESEFLQPLYGFGVGAPENAGDTCGYIKFNCPSKWGDAMDDRTNGTTSTDGIYGSQGGFARVAPTKFQGSTVYAGGTSGGTTTTGGTSGSTSRR